ncbi:MAG: hypothetical protein CL862_06040 [Cyanobium sp. NAT70]|nr:hypothetical protein [Cyanobium sp. NAT70]
MILLLLLLPLSYVAARMSVEWLWFSQFDWQNVLLERWCLELIFAGIAVVPVLLANHCRRRLSSDHSCERQPTGYVLQGGGFSLALLSTLLVLVISSVLISCLALLAIHQPFALDHWPAVLANNGQPYRHLIPAQVIITIVLAVRRQPMVWLTNAIDACVVLIAARAWGVWALAIRIPDSGLKDSILKADVSFALARFTAIRLGLELLLLLLVFNFAAALWLRLIRSPALSDWRVGPLRESFVHQCCRWLALIFSTTAALIWLFRHQLLWRQSGVVAGAGWLQEHLTMPVRSLFSVLLFGCAILLLLNSVGRQTQKLRRCLIAFLLLTVLLEYLITPLSRWLWLRPQELLLQTPYIEKAIQSTRDAFQLNQTLRRSVDPSAELTSNDLDEGASTLHNIRLWDSQPLLETNSQLQELRVYYRFSNPAVDRYRLHPDRDTAQQVILAARELDQSKLPRRSRTWLNRHFVFTHGYGFTLSPVNTYTEDGLPAYFISDLGSATRIEGNEALDISKDDVQKAVPVDHAALYFGALPSPYAVAPTDVDEFDYPEGDENVYNRYSGIGGVPIGSLWQRLAGAVYLNEPRLLTSPSIRDDTKLMIRREVRQRVRAIAPFLDLRGDPYLVSVPMKETKPGFLSSQHQYWIVEGYTRSSYYPYSAVVKDKNNRPDRYLRNSVKAVVDAFNGTVHLYVNEPNDPIIQGWANVFPQLFKPVESMPEQLRQHLRVPEDFFRVQVDQLLRYHVTDPRKFYSGDDVWQVPKEVYGRTQVPVDPYHITAQIQSNSSSEFLLLQPLTPQNRPNLTAWLAARNDDEGYGELLLIDFPQATPILGPEQIQALINQEPQISKLFGLWNRGGSEVIQGNLLVVPLGKTLLYVEPVYLRASKGGLPSLIRIVVSDGRSIAMGDSLQQAIDLLIKKGPPVKNPTEP